MVAIGARDGEGEVFSSGGGGGAVIALDSRAGSGGVCGGGVVVVCNMPPTVPVVMTYSGMSDAGESVAGLVERGAWTEVVGAVVFTGIRAIGTAGGA